MEEWSQGLRKLPLSSRLRWNESLKRFNTWRIGGDAHCLINVENETDLALLLPLLVRGSVPWFLLGKGSNLLIPDCPWPGVILLLSGSFKLWKPLEDPCSVSAGAAMADVTFAQRCVTEGWSGMEFMIGIPGTIGGAVATNAGAHGGETADFLTGVRWMDLHGKFHHNRRDELHFQYRNSELDAKQGRIVTSAQFRLKPSDSESVRKTLYKCQSFRKKYQPHNQPSCGSVFKNPTGDHAARLIELSGLKGVTRGDAQISPKHANFIVNLGQAKAEDMLGLMELIQEKVLQDHGVELVPEVQILQ